MNKLYLKVGVAITAAFAFGFVVGQALVLRKVDEMMRGEKENLDAVRDELIFQSTQAAVEEGEEPEMVRRKKPKEAKEKPMVRIFDIPAEMFTDIYGTTTDDEQLCRMKAANRIMKMGDIYENPEIIDALARIQRDKHSSMHLYDITPYNIPKEAKHCVLVYDRSNGNLYWMEKGDISHEEYMDIFVYLQTFSVSRGLLSGDLMFTTYSPLAFLEDRTLHLPDDEVELEKTRIFWHKDKNIVIEIILEDEKPSLDRARMFLEAYDEE